MTTRKPSKPRLALLLLAGLLLALPAPAAQRAQTYAEALEKAGSDGVIAYCYGPDWNRRSVRMLQSFWQAPATEAAAGDAVMVAVPFYQNSNAKGADEAATIRGGMDAPPFQVCPAVVLMDKSGRVYATLVGADYLGDENGELGAKNIQAKLGEFRRQQELMKKAEGLVGVEKAKLLLQVSDLGVKAPDGLLEAIELADPTDKTGAVRRNKHSALAFLYEQLETTDGFLAPDFEPDLTKIKEACFRIINDEAIRPVDRQAAYNLFIGESRREGTVGNQLKGFIKKNMKIDETTWYGRLCPELSKLWGTNSSHKTPEQRAAEREARKQAAKNKKDKKAQERKAGREIEID